MAQRQRHHTSDPAPPDVDTNAGDPNHHELRERATNLLAAADDVINRALSRDSSEFLSQNRQLGGQ